MPDQAGSYRPRVVRRGGRGGGYRNAQEPRPEKKMDDNGGGDYEDRERPVRRRYPRFLDPIGRRGRGPRQGGGRRAAPEARSDNEGDEVHESHDHDQDHDDGVAEKQQRPQQQRRRRPRPRVTSKSQADKSDSAREHSGPETDNEQRDDEEKPARRRNADGKRVGPERRRPRNERPSQGRIRSRRTRLPKVYSPEEFNKVKSAVIKLSKRLIEKKDMEEDELNEVIKDLVKYFEESELKNPYEITLKMLMVAAGLENADALFSTILKALDLVLRGEDTNSLAQDLQGKAFVLSKAPELASCADELANLFELKGLTGDKLKLLVEELLKCHLYKEALTEVGDNGLEKEFTVEQVVVPLVIQHYIAPVENMLKKNSHYLEPLIRFLDKTIGMSFSEMIAEVEKYQVPYMIGLGRQFLVRVILSWQGMFDFSIDWCPNIKMFYARQHFYYFNRRRFRVKDLPYVNWMELTLDLVKENPELARDVVDELVRYNKNAEAKYWGERFNVNIEDMAGPVKEAIEGAEDAFDLEAAKNEPAKQKEEKNLYEVDFKDDDIKFVDKENDCKQAFDTLMQKSKVGIDVEWKPDTGIGPNDVSLLQISTEENVFVFDVKALKGGTALVDGLNKLLVGELVKIGFNVSRDIGFLERSLGVELKFKEAVHVVDLRVLQDRFYSGRVDFLFPNANRRDFKRRMYNSYEMRSMRGLNSLVKAVFGKNLDRVELISNWDQRPLRPSQLRFAATDAMVLIEVYNEVSEEAKKNEKDLEDLLKKPAGGRDQSAENGGDSSGHKGDEGTDSGGDKTGEDSGRSSRNDNRGGYRSGGGRRMPQRGYGGGYRGRGRAGRYRGGGRGYYSRAPLGPRQPRDDRYPPASKKEEILDNGEVPEIMSSPKKPKEMKIVTDNMLLGLGRALQERGFDVFSLRRGDPHEDCIDKFKAEKRVILTQGRIFYEFKDQVTPGYCFKVVNRKVQDQIGEVIEAYQVELDDEDVGDKENQAGVKQGSD